MEAVMAAVPEQILGKNHGSDSDPGETQEWLQALDGVIRNEGVERAAYLIDQQISHARINGVNQPFHAETPYIITHGSKPSMPPRSFSFA